MKLFLLGSIFLLSLSVNAKELGYEAAEMFELLTHADVSKCVSKANLSEVTIDREVYRCPGCTTYTIRGQHKTKPNHSVVFTISGKVKVLPNGKLSQGWTCKKEKQVTE